MDILPYYPWWYSTLPLIIIGLVIFSVAFLIIIGILIGKRLTLNLRTGGAVALTLASILLLSGVWCMFLSPPITNYDTKDNFYISISIDNQTSWSYNFDIQKSDTIDGSINGFRTMYENRSSIMPSELFFNVKIYDPNNDVVWSKSRVTYAYFNLEAPKTGNYRVEVKNLNKEIIECNIQVNIRGEVTYRPLNPPGQWLSLISLPIFGLGIWASGLISRTAKSMKKSRD